MSAARIGRIRLKAGGAEVRVLHRELPEDGENWRGTMVDHARKIAEGQPRLTGFVVVGLFEDGTYNCGSRLHRDSPVGPTMLPSYVAEIVRRELLSPLVIDDNL